MGYVLCTKGQGVWISFASQIRQFLNRQQPPPPTPSDLGPQLRRVEARSPLPAMSLLVRTPTVLKGAACVAPPSALLACARSPAREHKRSALTLLRLHPLSFAGGGRSQGRWAVTMFRSRSCGRSALLWRRRLGGRGQTAARWTSPARPESATRDFLLTAANRACASAPRTSRPLSTPGACRAKAPAEGLERRTRTSAP